MCVTEKMLDVFVGTAVTELRKCAHEAVLLALFSESMSKAGYHHLPCTINGLLDVVDRYARRKNLLEVFQRM